MPNTKSGQRRVQIEELAVKLFARSGYHLISVADIGSESHMTSSALYRHYKNKQDLLATVVHDGLGQFREVLEQSSNAASSSLEFLTRLAAATIEHREVPLLWLREVRHLEQESSAIARRKLDDIKSALGSSLSNLDPVEDASTRRITAVLSSLWSIAYHRATPTGSGFERLLGAQARNVWRADPPDCPMAPELGGGSNRFGRVSQRERLLTVSSQLFAERGWPAVRMDDIGEVLGVSGASVYQHFSSKEDILYKALWRASDALHLSLGDALRTADSKKDALERVLASYCEVATVHPGFTQLLVSEVKYLSGSSYTEIVATQREYVAGWCYLLREVFPRLSAANARVLVQASHSVVNDLTRAADMPDRSDIRSAAIAFGRAALTPAVNLE